MYEFIPKSFLKIVCSDVGLMFPTDDSLGITRFSSDSTNCFPFSMFSARNSGTGC